MGAGFWVNLIAAGGVAGVVLWSVIGWLDRQVGAPVMKERINKGSDKYFDEEGRNWGAVTLDSIVRLKFEDEPEAEADDQDEERAWRLPSRQRRTAVKGARQLTPKRRE
jgi:hypothetical protein